MRSEISPIINLPACAHPTTWLSARSLTAGSPRKTLHSTGIKLGTSSSVTGPGDVKTSKTHRKIRGATHFYEIPSGKLT